MSLGDLLDNLLDSVVDLFDGSDADVDVEVEPEVDPDVDVDAGDADVNLAVDDVLDRTAPDCDGADMGLDVNDDAYVQAVNQQLGNDSKTSFTSACWDVFKASSGDPGNRLTCGYN